jgi:small subunit ribosomal protein S21
MSRRRSRKRRKAADCLEVYLDEVNGDLERAISKLSKMVEEEGILDLHLEQKRYEKPSDRKRRKRAQARYRRQKEK